MYDYDSDNSHDNDNCPLCCDIGITRPELLADNLRMSFDIEVGNSAELDALLDLLNRVGTVVAVQKLG